MARPERPKIYHIVHVDRLGSIVANGCLWSDAIMAERVAGTTIGMSGIKLRRRVLPVRCHVELRVGDCVPFYLCPRSIMLYVIHRANHEELDFRGGQEPIVHLESDLETVVDWADANGRRWAVSLSNAGARYAEFRTGRDCFGEINWQAVAATDFRSPDIKEGKQAEFLVERELPWTLVDRIGVRTQAVAARVAKALTRSSHRPAVAVRADWYY